MSGRGNYGELQEYRERQDRRETAIRKQGLVPPPLKYSPESGSLTEAESYVIEALEDDATARETLFAMREWREKVRVLSDGTIYRPQFPCCRVCRDRVRTPAGIVRLERHPDAACFVHPANRLRFILKLRGDEDVCFVCGDDRSKKGHYRNCRSNPKQCTLCREYHSGLAEHGVWLGVCTFVRQFARYPEYPSNWKAGRQVRLSIEQEIEKNEECNLQTRAGNQSQESTSKVLPTIQRDFGTTTNEVACQTTEDLDDARRRILELEKMLQEHLAVCGQRGSETPGTPEASGRTGPAGPSGQNGFAGQNEQPGHAGPVGQDGFPGNAEAPEPSNSSD